MEFELNVPNLGIYFEEVLTAVQNFRAAKYRPKIYVSHPMRGKKGNTKEGNIDHNYQNQNSAIAVLNTIWLRKRFPRIDFYCPGEVELPVQTFYKLGLVSVEEILTMDCNILENCCCGTLALSWEDSVGVAREVQKTTELGYPLFIYKDTPYIWNCQEGIYDFIQTVMKRFETEAKKNV